MQRSIGCLVATQIMLLSAIPAKTADSVWPQFRGPGALGVQEVKGLPEAWGNDQNIAWKTTIPGYGWSSPIVWGEKVFLTSVIKDGEVETPKKGLYFGGERPTPSKDVHHWNVYCLELRTGKLLWEKEVLQGPPAGSLHLKNTYASETPVTDGERVYAYFGNVGLFCLDFEGKEIWSQRFAAHKTRNGWGTAASPVLHGDKVFVVNDNEEQSFLAAFNKKSGRQVWRVERDEKSNWATPYVWENEERTEIVTPGRKRVRSYDSDGRLLWELGGMSSIVIPTPFSKFDLLYVCSGYVGDKARPVFAIHPGASGDISLADGAASNPYIAWCQRTAAPYNPSPLVYGAHFYVLFDFGFLSCHDARTGAEVYGKQRINTEGTSAFTASPWAYNGKIFCLSEDGDTFVVQAGPEYKLLRKNSLNEMCMATPAIAGDRLLIRTASKLFCVRDSTTSPYSNERSR
ncbi:MAG: PQQ-binding-like beta-propeller repeat protein [Verrucomicrobia bacterium]|nr:PQQ-binding-like beta-propeller repeat protein [Verrucomicrobiota bacterium]